MRASIDRDAGSFRDPDSWIFNAGDRILRRIPKDLVDLIGRPDVATFLKSEVTAGRLIESVAVSEQDAAKLGLEPAGDGGAYLSHPRLPFVSYPYEWSATMLADAARLTLDLQCGLLPLGVELKDATAFNVLFSQGRPVFVDWGSFRTPFRPDIWYALGQFQRMFLHPLLLKAARGSTPTQCFLSNLDGVPLSTVANELGSRRMWMSPSLWLDIALPYWVESRNRKRTTQSENDPALHRRPLAVRSDFQQSNLRRIRRMVDRLETKFIHAGEWQNYALDCHYDPAADESKRGVVSEFLRLAKPATVIDLGCNAGDYSTLAAKTGARVIAVDGDEGAIARLYARLKISPADINPVVINLGNPTPPMGWCNQERRGFLERGRSDLVMALALIHHLRVSCNWPIDHIVEFLSALTADSIVAEFVPREDPMFRAITRLRDEDFADWTLARWHASLLSKFDLVREIQLPASARTIALWRRR